MRSENGILARVPGELIGRGSLELPRAGADQNGEPRRNAVLEVPDVGPVRITYELRTYRRGKARLWAWVAIHAAPEAAAEA